MWENSKQIKGRKVEKEEKKDDEEDEDENNGWGVQEGGAGRGVFAGQDGGGAGQDGGGGGSTSIEQLCKDPEAAPPSSDPASSATVSGSPKDKPVDGIGDAAANRAANVAEEEPHQSICRCGGRAGEDGHHRF